MNDKESTNWKFWIDVGGTFTDCVAVAPDGTEIFSKVLSSGVIKSRIQFRKLNLADSIQANSRDSKSWWGFDATRTETNDFWNGATLRLFDALGRSVWEGMVSRFFRVQEQGNEVGCFELIPNGPNHGSLVHETSAPAPRFRKNDPSNASLNLFPGSDSEFTFRYELDAGLPAPILAIHLLQQVPIQQSLLPCQVDFGTTRGTNALLTRTGSPTALVTSKGLQDFLRIGDQARTKLFALTVEKPKPLFQTAIEIEERVLANGTVELIPDETLVAQQLKELKSQGIESLAICFMFGFRYPAHEQLVAEVARRVGFRSIRCSSDVAPVIKIVPRGETTVLDAYLDPVIATYVEEISARLSTSGAISALRLMTSSGGLVSKGRFSGKDSVLSGPAGGVVGASRVGQQLGFDQVIGFDMGGTSTDVCRFDGHYTRSFETYKAGVRIVTPMLEVETVAAGGGSVCWFDGTRLRVGPQSAGANPGPACYGRGGPLAITDINLFLGRFQPDRFPFELDLAAVERRLDELVEATAAASYSMDRIALAEGFLQIANHNMSAAIESVSIARGFDPREYVLVSFGGAGSQHCCGVADRLDMTRILDHPQSSVLSAVGIQLADQAAHAVEGVNGLLENPGHAKAVQPDFFEMEARLNDELLPKLVGQAISQMQSDGNTLNNVQLESYLDLRYRGTDPFLTVSYTCHALDIKEDRPTNLRAGSLATTLEQFFRLHKQQFGYLQNRPIELVSVRVEVRQPGNRLSKIDRPVQFTKRNSKTLRQLHSSGRLQTAGVFDRDGLHAGEQIVGPALVADSVSTTIIDQGWVANVFESGILLLEKNLTGSSERLEQRKANEFSKPDPIQLEIFNSHFSTIAGQMGISLQKTSISVNVKERLDFSCAIFSGLGDLVVNAPHIPVHLGAMSETVRSIIELNPQVKPGDVFVTNDPYAGGSHLPDVTVVTPVFAPQGSKLWFWVASRSHHAEIGGMAPGSMPAGATRLGEEGVLIQNFQLIDGEVERFEELRQKLTFDPYPSRSPDENIADLRAQVVANRTGAAQLLRLVEQHSFEMVAAYMRHIQDAAEDKVRAALRKLSDGEFPFVDQLDNGAIIRVLLTKQDDQLTIDFSGTDPVLPDNLNANRAIVSAAVMYVLRLLIDEDIPLNEGVLKPVSLILPESFLNPRPAENPVDSPAIVGGNVETSQRVVDCLLGALGLAAASQGTMNNWLMGNQSFGYYETVGGGSGATPQGAGADAVHCHMTNTRLTDPEILETRYPVILREFAIRRGSGGNGRHRGGDGMIREIEFQQPMTVSLLTSRRVNQPFGLAGGDSGKRGVNQLIRKDRPIDLPSRCEIAIQPGDRLRLETPGGGGWGIP